jgi:hypothetical protein
VSQAALARAHASDFSEESAGGDQGEIQLPVVPEWRVAASLPQSPSEVGISSDYVARLATSKRRQAHIDGMEQTPTMNPADYDAPTYPKELVWTFGGGLVLFGVGIVVLVIAFVVRTQGLQFAAAVLLIVGSVAVVLSLLRGQDIDERTR